MWFCFLVHSPESDTAGPVTDSSNPVGLVEKTLIYLYSMHTEGSPPPVLVMINDKMSTVIN